MPLHQRMKFIEVRKGAISRAIDIGRFSGFEELTQALAHMFGMRGQLRVGPTIGWNCFYQDVEDDTMLLGDGTWEFFVRTVRSIQIVFLPEVHQMSVGGRLRSRL